MKILIPVDGQRHSKTAEDYAIFLNGKMAVKVILLHVVDTGELDGHGLDPGLKESVLERKRAWGEKTLAEAFNGLKKAGLDVEKKIEQGNPANMICYHAQTGDYDMILITETGYGEFGDWLMSSITNHVLHRCSIPVLMVKRPKSGLG